METLSQKFARYREMEKIAAGYWRMWAQHIKKETVAANIAKNRAIAHDAATDVVGDEITAELSTLGL